MISLLEAQNYRCLHYVSRPLDSFHVLVGPNASGKTTFLDVVSFMGDLVSSGLEAAITERTANFQDGTLRLLALTVPAYLPGFSGVYLIEEPENGIHPRAVETIFQSLSSVYGAQILMATHSPVILGMADASSVLCFAKTPEGATDIVSGSEHPALKEWQGETNLGTLFASGVLG